MQRYEIKNYFGKSYASTCQHCGITIYRQNKNGNDKHAWLKFVKNATDDVLLQLMESHENWRKYPELNYIYKMDELF